MTEANPDLESARGLLDAAEHAEQGQRIQAFEQAASLLESALANDAG